MRKTISSQVAISPKVYAAGALPSSEPSQVKDLQPSLLWGSQTFVSRPIHQSQAPSEWTLVLRWQSKRAFSTGRIPDAGKASSRLLECGRRDPDRKARCHRDATAPPARQYLKQGSVGQPGLANHSSEKPACGVQDALTR